uniref:Uncharacterized protein TCIL3000_2_1430 n=1 Tax=Trypanosoma congolense (strain IL3000) TaxID=1068625 RepID=G0UJL2_TRYCI|nr:unnamed protein product [Trypanosoma congolense IL3000]
MSYVGDLMRRGIPVQVIIAGPTGSGKQTQSKIIAERLGIVHVSSGDIIKAGAQDGPVALKMAESYASSGTLVPDTLISAVMAHRLGQDDVLQKGWLMEGYPRNLQQAKSMEVSGFMPHVFVQLEIPEDVIHRRLEHRRKDPATGDEYHLLDDPPPEEDVALCERLVRDERDSHAEIERRLVRYKETIDELRSHFAAIIEVVNADQSVEDVTRDILAAVERHRFH